MPFRLDRKRQDLPHQQPIPESTILSRGRCRPCLRQPITRRDERPHLLLERLVTLEQKVRYRVEVLEEDNSKAIFIFTVVAAVFLPLSFVTSYLGMNTVDIRDMNRSQSIFWATAVPATFGVVALAILAAYRDAVREWAREKRRKLRRPALMSSKAATNDDYKEKSKSLNRRAKMRKGQDDIV